MQRQSTRRTFLTAVGVAGGVSLAGCSSIPGSGDSSKQDGTATATQTSNGTRTDGKNGSSNGGGKKNGNGNQSSTRGTVVDDFEGTVDSRWGISHGRYKTTKQDAFQGNQSLVLEPKKNAKTPVAKISKAFYPKTLDLSSHDLSIVAKVKKPKDVKISAEVIAPAESDMLTATRYIPIEMDDWVRFDFGYTGKQGKPAMDSVSQVNIQVGPMEKGTDFQVLVDDLRKIPKPKKGKVMFQFDDGHVSAYEKAFPLLQEKGWPGSVAVIPDAVNSEDRLTNSMMREMGKANWDMMSHPGTGTPLPQLPAKRQRRLIRSAKQALDVKGFEDGARHFVAPYSRVDKTTLDIISEFHETGFLFGACPNNAQLPSNPHFISRVQGPAVRGARQAIDVANDLNQLVVVAYHTLGGDGTPMNKFKEIVNHVEKKNMDVITPSQLIDQK